MSSLQTRLFAGILVAFTLGVAPCMAQDNASLEKSVDQLQSDKKELTADQQLLSEYQQQAKWYEDFAKRRLANADVEKQEVEKRLQALEVNPKSKDPNSTIGQEVKALRGWLKDETTKRALIERTRERWRSALETQTAKSQETGYEVDVDKATVGHDKELASEQAARNKDFPKPKSPQIQQNTVLMPGWETEQGDIPTLLGPKGTF